MLRGKGFDAHWKLKLETPAPVEPTGNKGRRRVGAGRTDYLLWRLHEAGRLTQPALFLCDRDALREQAWEKLAKAFPKGSVRIVETDHGDNAAKNAKVHIATYQTLGLARHTARHAYSVALAPRATAIFQEDA